MSRSLGILLAVGGVILAVVGLLFIFVIFRQTVAPPPAATQVPAITIPVVITTRAVQIRSLLRAQDVTVVNMPVEFAPLDAVSEVEAVIGTITKIPLAAGEIVMRHHLADPTNISQNLAFIIADDQVVMAFLATDLMSQVDVLQPGDLVDILVSVEVPVLPADPSLLPGNNGQEQQEEDELFTFNALQRVTIQAIVVEITPPTRASTTSASASSATLSTPAPTATPGPELIEAQAILVALSPQDALILKHLKDAGGIVDIVLRAPTSNRIFDLDPVSSEYLKDKYELVPETEP